MLFEEEISKIMVVKYAGRRITLITPCKRSARLSIYKTYGLFRNNDDKNYAEFV